MSYGRRHIALLVDLQVKLADLRVARETRRVRAAIEAGEGPDAFNKVKAKHPEDAQAVANALAGGGS